MKEDKRSLMLKQPRRETMPKGNLVNKWEKAPFCVN